MRRRFQLIARLNAVSRQKAFGCHSFFPFRLNFGHDEAAFAGADLDPKIGNAGDDAR